MYILVVDDDADIRDAIADFLKAAGYDAKLACHGRDALDLMRDDMPAVVILDVNMPVMDGLQCLATMRIDASLAHIPVIVISANDPNGVAHVHGTMHKPFAMSALLALVRSALSA